MRLLKGKSIYHDNYKKTINRLLKNLRGDTIVEWTSNQPNNSVGVVTTALWAEWEAGIDQRDRRACDMCECDPKPYRYRRRRY